MNLCGLNWRGIRAVMTKDLTVVLRSKMILLPMILLPVMLQVLMPAAFGIAAYFAGDAIAGDLEDLQVMIAWLPAEVQGRLAAQSPGQVFLEIMLVYAFAPMYLIIPMMVSSVVAADSFVGERERKTLEALLYTPLTDSELLLAKILTAWLAAVVVGVGSFLLYIVMVNLIGWLVVDGIAFPNLMWLVLVFWVSPAVAGLGLGVTVLLSTRVNTFQEAYQLGSMIVLPVVALMIGQFAGVLSLSVLLAIGLGAGVWLVDALIFWFGVKTFNRDALIARL
ncbi:MAG: ABC transporter permease subunit [Anaerolineae bacterium]|nr:ABC transporter permease subunit [Anaerolineae bacterium]